MQFISGDSVLVSVRPEIPPVYDNEGRAVSLRRRRLFAQFRRGEVPAWAWAEAARVYPCDYRPPDWPIEAWISCYDSREDQSRQNWDDEEREIIEEYLLAQGYYKIEKPRSPLPYKTYLEHRKIVGRRTVEHAVADIRKAIEAAGIDPLAIAAYEHDHQDEYSKQIVDSLEVEEEPEEKLIRA